MSQSVAVDPGWYEQAACQNQGWQKFFDEPDPTAAQRLCAGCPVRIPCLRFAMSQGIDNGIWGGLTPEQRRRTRASTTWAA